MAECPAACPTIPRQTESFTKIHAAIAQELRQRNLPGIGDLDELAMALSVLVADALSLNIYE